MLQIKYMVDLERERRRPYFVDLDFFNNDYSQYICGKYFQIVERDVTDWNKIKSTLEKNRKINKNSKIVKIY